MLVILGIVLAFGALGHAVLPPPSAEQVAETEALEAAVLELSQARRLDVLKATDGTLLMVVSDHKPGNPDIALDCLNNEPGKYEMVRELASAGYTLVPDEQQDQAQLRWVRQDPATCKEP